MRFLHRRSAANPNASYTDTSAAPRTDADHDLRNCRHCQPKRSEQQSQPHKCGRGSTTAEAARGILESHGVSPISITGQQHASALLFAHETLYQFSQRRAPWKSWS
jgi:hypothetical protein